MFNCLASIFSFDNSHKSESETDVSVVILTEKKILEIQDMIIKIFGAFRIYCDLKKKEDICCFLGKCKRFLRSS